MVSSSALVCGGAAVEGGGCCCGAALDEAWGVAGPGLCSCTCCASATRRGAVGERRVVGELCWSNRAPPAEDGCASQDEGGS